VPRDNFTVTYSGQAINAESVTPRLFNMALNELMAETTSCLPYHPFVASFSSSATKVAL
jgi:hypothetical protein